MIGEPTTPKCGRGHCTAPATVVCHIDYPKNPITGQAPFRWSKPMCDEDVEVERVGARFSHAVVTTEPLSTLAVAS